MPGPAKKSWRSYLPDRVRDWLRSRELRRDIRSLDDQYGPLADNARGDEEQQIVSEWMFEVDFPRSELAVLETRKLLKIANRWLVDVPPTNDAGSWTHGHETPIGVSFLQDPARRKLRKAIRDARRENVRWWIQVTVIPLTGLIGATIGLLAFLRRG